MKSPDFSSQPNRFSDNNREDFVASGRWCPWIKLLAIEFYFSVVGILA